MKTRYAFPVVAVLYTAVYWAFAGPGPHGWSQPRVETKAPEPKWIPITGITNEFYGEWPNNNWDSLIYKPKEPKEYPILFVLREYAKTNVAGYYEQIPRPKKASEDAWTNLFIEIEFHPTATNVANMLVIGYFDGDLSKPIELMEVEKPQKKAP